MDRLKTYFQEATIHKEHIIEAKSVISLPIKDYEKLSKLEKFALNTLIFRFSKLQDLMGRKIFRAYLNFLGLATDEFSFFDILKELEKEGVLDIDEWHFLRKLRNDIAHDYPEELEERLQKVNLFVEKSDELLKILKNLEKRYYEIKQSRG